MTNIIRLFTFVSLLPLASFALAAPNKIPEPILKSLSAHKMEPEALSLAVIPLTGNGSPNFVNADVSTNPASIMKLFTSYAALELLGPNYRWQTAFYTDGEIKNGILNGNLYLKGGGDPKLNMEKLWLLLRDLKINGVKTVAGDLVLDQNYFNITTGKDSFNDDGNEFYRPYLVSPDSLLINFKVLRVIVRTEDNKSKILIEPPIRGIDITNNVKVVKPRTKGRCPAVPDIKYTPVPLSNGTVSLTVTGSLAEDCSVQTYLSLFDHQRYAAGIVRSIWKELGGEIKGSDKMGIIPKNAKLLAVAYSPDLVEVIRDVNKYSNNTMAKQVFLSIGKRYRKDIDADDSAAAFRAIYEWLGRKGVNGQQLRMENGSGLSRNERITAREMAGLLKLAWESDYQAEFIASMPIVGVDGTMYKRLRNTVLKGKGHIKTGTLKNVRAIAGYITDRNGDTWAVAAILNHPKPWGATEVLDDILLNVYDPALPRKK